MLHHRKNDAKKQLPLPLSPLPTRTVKNYSSCYHYCLLLLALVGLCCILNNNHNNNNNNILNESTITRRKETVTNNDKQEPIITSTTDKQPTKSNEQPITDTTFTCAIAFYGLPRSFKDLVLPSIVTNIITPNWQYNCDYFVHYYQVDYEAAGRSGNGGKIDSKQVLLLEDAIEYIYEHAENNEPPTIQFAFDTNATFWQQRGDWVEKVRTAKMTSNYINNNDFVINDNDNNSPTSQLLYWPHRDKSLEYPTATDNILKMWHSQTSVWNLLETHAIDNDKHYDRILMLRSDVFFVTPINVKRGYNNNNNNNAIIPGFASFPVNDRMILGNFETVKMWASQRWDLIDRHVRYTIPRVAPGYGMHSERFLYYTLFTKIKSELYQDWQICFLRARSDGTLWATDCGERPFDIKKKVETILQDFYMLEIASVLELSSSLPCFMAGITPWNYKIITLDCTSPARFSDAFLTRWLPALLWNPPWKDRKVYRELN